MRIGPTGATKFQGRPDSPSNWRALGLDDRSLQSVDTSQGKRSEPTADEVHWLGSHLRTFEGEVEFHDFGIRLLVFLIVSSRLIAI